MKLLVLLAVLGVAAAQHTVYSGLLPHAYNYGALPYANHYPTTYAAGAYSAYPYSAYPFAYSGLPYAFKPVKAAEEKPAEAPAVEATRKKRDVLPNTGSVAIHAANAFPYAYPSLYSGAAYTYAAAPAAYAAAPATYAAAPITYTGYHGYSPLVHTLKKRDTAAAEDQEAEDATLYTTYASHPYAYNAYPYSAAASVYSNAAYPYNYGFYNAHPYNVGTYRYAY